MTIDELKAIPFHFVCSAAWETEHTMTYESEDGRLGFCDHTPKRKNGDFGKGYRHWHIDGKVYKTKEKFIAALADFNPNVLPINRRPYQMCHTCPASRNAYRASVKDARSLQH